MRTMRAMVPIVSIRVQCPQVCALSTMVRICMQVVAYACALLACMSLVLGIMCFIGVSSLRMGYRSRMMGITKR